MKPAKRPFAHKRKQTFGKRSKISVAVDGEELAGATQNRAGVSTPEKCKNMRAFGALSLHH